MARAALVKRYPMLAALVAVLMLLLAIYLPLRLRTGGRAPEPPAPGTAISIFATAELNGYREPC